MQVFSFSEFRLDTAARRLVRDGQAIPLPQKAFDMLVMLIERAGSVITKDEFLQELWPDVAVEEANLTVNVSALRKALGDDATGPRFIATVAGVGYKFVAEVTAAGGAVEPVPRTETPVDPGAVGTEVTGRAASSRWVLAAVAVIAAGVMIAAAVKLSRDASPSPGPSGPVRRIVPLTSLPGLKTLPVFSPDGSQIAFVWYGERSDNADVYVKQVAGDGMLRLTTNPAVDSGPAWSPNGRDIAFIRSDTEGGAAVFIMPALGGAERKLTDVRGVDYLQNLAWSPDGRFLAFSDRAPDGPRTIVLLSLTDGQRWQITAPTTRDVEDGSPAFSPDGRQLAFLRGSSFFASDIYVMPIATGAPPASATGPRRLTSDGRWISGLAWGRDGRSIVFSSNRSGLSSLWILPVEGGRPQPLGAGMDDAVFPAVSPDGRHLAYARMKSDSNIWRVPGPAATSGDAAPVRLIASTRDDALPQFSPDGTRVAFLSTRSGSEEIWIGASDGTAQVQVTSLQGASGGTPRWSPDGRRLAFDWRRDGHADIFTIGVEGRDVRRLTTATADDVVPSWSRDGRWVYFASGRGSGSQIWKVPAEGGQPVQVTDGGGFEPFESVDGSRVFYTKGSGIWQRPLTGGDEAPVVDGVEYGFWGVTDRELCWLNRHVALRDLVQCFEFGPRRTRTVATLEKGFDIPGPPGFAISPDRQSVLVQRADYGDYDLMLVEHYTR